jgi:FtsP/CotA-like multicopper oxidase with cupredoxin domain
MTHQYVFLSIGCIPSYKIHCVLISVQPLPNGYPWGSATCNNTNPYDNPPNTGVIRPYTLTISRGIISPDGVNKSVLLINDQFPGPLLQANWGDTFQITVINQITGPEEGTSLHWHGILQKTTPYYDGV